MRTAAALVIGNELLSGKIQDQNILVLARTLRSVGVLLKRVVMVLDDKDTIAAEVTALANAHDVVFTSGGVGPTHDDVTISAVAQAFGVGVVESNEIATLLKNYYGSKITAGHLAMAKVPEGAKLSASVENVWPAIIKENVWVLPGVPQVFAMKMPLVTKALELGFRFVSLSLCTTLDEGNLKERLDAVVEAHPGVDIGSYPTWEDPRYRTKLTFDGVDPTAVKTARDAMAAALPPESLVIVD